jgi:hypothetical protein
MLLLTPAVRPPFRGGASGTWNAWPDGYGTRHTDTVSSRCPSRPVAPTRRCRFWLHIDTSETTTTVQFDKLTVQVGATTLATYSNLNHAIGYAQKSFNVGSFAGQTVTVKFTGTDDTALSPG